MKEPSSSDRRPGSEDIQAESTSETSLQTAGSSAPGADKLDEKTAGDSHGQGLTPARAIGVTVYHTGCVLASIVLIAIGYEKVGWFDDPALRIAALGVGSGVVGGTLNASRYVVYSVRHREYDPARVLWQVMTPLHSGVFAGFSLALGQAGLIIASEQLDSAANGYLALVVSLSFLVGFSSELFVKRLIAASEALFGEAEGLEGADASNKRKKKKSNQEDN